MKSLFRPTLVRRVVLVLFSAFPVIWLVLLFKQYLEIRLSEDHHDPALAQFGVQVADILSAFEEPAETRAVAVAIDQSAARMRQRNHARRVVLLQVWDRRDRRLVFSSPGAVNQVLRGDPTRQVKQLLQGETYDVFEADTPYWTILVAQTSVNSQWLAVALIHDMTPNMLTALFILLLPTWLAVSQGLRPLRRLSERIAARGPEDLAPIGIDPQHAELKPLVAALDGLLAQLRNKIESEQAFVGNAAHELRTPLAVINAQAHVLAHAANQRERAEAEQRLDAAIARASHLIHQLLVLVRTEMEQRPKPEAQDLAQLVRQELGHFVPAAMTRSIEISLEAPDKLVLPLEVHPFQSVLQNLIDNAIRYGRDGGRIVVELHCGESAVTLSVADDGPGIADNAHSLVFDRFYRGAGHDVPGTGLGLTIVKQAAARMGGKVGIAQGLDGRGCCFTVDIPATSSSGP